MNRPAVNSAAVNRMRDVSRAELLAPWRPGAARAELAKLGGSCPSLAALAPTAESDTAPIAARWALLVLNHEAEALL